MPEEQNIHAHHNCYQSKHVKRDGGLSSHRFILGECTLTSLSAGVVSRAYNRDSGGTSSVVRVVGPFLLAATLLLVIVGATPAESTRQAAPCRGQLRFLKPTSEGVSSAQVLFYFKLKNTGRRACVAPHFLMVEVPRKTAAPVSVQPRVGGDLVPVVGLARPLLVQPGKIVETSVILDTPCGGIVGTVVAKVVFAVDEWPVDVKTSISFGFCRTEANEIEIYPLAHP